MNETPIFSIPSGKNEHGTMRQCSSQQCFLATDGLAAVPQCPQDRKKTETLLRFRFQCPEQGSNLHRLFVH